jgi:hypothetical protein
MKTRKARGLLPARLEGVRRRFERWRETRKNHSRIPDSLWASAAVMADTYGMSRTAHVLRVNYDALKKHVQQRMATAAGSLEAESSPSFVELTSFASAGSCECLLELENGGAKMRIQVKSIAMPDLAALSQSFWNRQP